MVLYVSLGLNILFCIILIWFYVFYARKLDCEKIDLDYMIENNLFRTGDLILFKATDCLHGLKLANYFTHAGIVYILNCIPYIFEAEYAHSIVLSPLRDRVLRYRGFCYVKSLNIQLPNDVLREFDDFINYAINDMYYDRKVVSKAVEKIIGKTCDTGTNCAELAFLCMLRLGLLPITEYYTYHPHYLRYITNIALQKPYKYSDPVRLTYPPFKYSDTLLNVKNVSSELIDSGYIS